MSDGEETISLQTLMDAYIRLKHDVGGLAGAMTQDMEKVNFLLFHLLKDLGKVEEEECPSCKAPILIPMFDSVEENHKVCNLCGWTDAPDDIGDEEE
tara:strand:- start:957 stop:1247 length:291 start_codon:yes stop_codon:yes gene_type:complete